VLVKEFDLQCHNGILITILATCLATQNDKATVMEETKKCKVVDRTNSEHNLLNNLQW
jgi:hypothetical protein